MLGGDGAHEGVGDIHGGMLFELWRSVRVRREDVVHWGGGVAARVFKGHIGGAEEVTAGEWGYNEECFLTFLACPTHCSRLMRRWRDRARIQRQDKLSVRRPARSG